MREQKKLNKKVITTIHKHFKKKHLIEKLWWFLPIEIAIFLGICCYIFAYSRLSKRTIEQEISEPEMQFVFTDTDATQYDIFPKNIHASWINWDFLFGKKGSEKKENTIKINILQKDYVDIDTTIQNLHNDLKDIKVMPQYQDCTLPRGGTIQNNEFVLAYEQRNDEPNICNIEKRYCDNGKLSGSYKEKACKEIEIKKTQYHKYTIHNSTKKGELIQSENRRTLAFNPKKFYTPKGQNTIRNNTVKKRQQEKTLTVNTPSLQENKSCISPRGSEIFHGQFTKAYERAKGFNNVSCKVEVRICLDGELKGDYTHESCEYIDTDYTTYYSNPNNRDEDYERDHKKYSNLQYSKSISSEKEKQKTMEIIKKLKNNI